jgi:hypothetical protein
MNGGNRNVNYRKSITVKGTLTDNEIQVHSNTASDSDGIAI